MRSPSATIDDAWAARVTAGIANGSREALASLYEARFELLYRTARDRTGRDESFGLDCVQDAMLRIADTLPRIDRIASLDAWLRRAVLTAALDRLRAERRRAGREESKQAQRDAATWPVDAALDERLAEIAAELERLSDDDRSLLALRFRRGLTLAELAAHLGVAPKAIDSRIRRTLARIKANLRGTSASEESP